MLRISGLSITSSFFLCYLWHYSFLSLLLFFYLLSQHDDWTVVAFFSLKFCTIRFEFFPDKEKNAIMSGCIILYKALLLMSTVVYSFKLFDQKYKLNKCKNRRKNTASMCSVHAKIKLFFLWNGKTMKFI